jgi:2-C-methyl-D-erythritol 4-phosphate cytidylyltransferase
MLNPGAPNLKVTTPADLRLAEVLLGAGRIT